MYDDDNDVLGEEIDNEEELLDTPPEGIEEDFDLEDPDSRYH